MILFVFEYSTLINIYIYSLWKGLPLTLPLRNVFLLVHKHSSVQWERITRGLGVSLPIFGFFFLVDKKTRKINMEHNSLEVWFRSFSFLFMGDGCRFHVKSSRVYRYYTHIYNQMSLCLCGRTKRQKHVDCPNVAKGDASFTISSGLRVEKKHILYNQKQEQQQQQQQQKQQHQHQQQPPHHESWLFHLVPMFIQCSRSWTWPGTCTWTSPHTGTAPRHTWPGYPWKSSLSERCTCRDSGQGKVSAGWVLMGLLWGVKSRKDHGTTYHVMNSPKLIAGLLSNGQTANTDISWIPQNQKLQIALLNV